MSNPWVRLGLFMALLALVFALGLGFGSGSDVNPRGGPHPTNSHLGDPGGEMTHRPDPGGAHGD